jgi:hypothetical protein
MLWLGRCRCANDGQYSRLAMELLAWDLSVGTPWRQGNLSPVSVSPTASRGREEEEAEEGPLGGVEVGALSMLLCLHALRTCSVLVQPRLGGC